jgi:hypothetical protein
MLWSVQSAISNWAQEAESELPWACGLLLPSLKWMTADTDPGMSLGFLQRDTVWIGWARASAGLSSKCLSSLHPMSSFVALPFIESHEF